MLENRAFVLCAVLAWIGLTLLLSELRWFRRVPLTQRLAPYAGTANLANPSNPPQAMETFRQALTPIVNEIGERLTSLLGVQDDLQTRLDRAGMNIEAGSFRVRQFAWALASVGVGLLLAAALELPTTLAIFFVLGAPLLSFLLLEQQVITAVNKRQQVLFAELPVVAEQLATLIGAGYSLGSALSRIAERNKGASGEDLRRVCDRVRQGLSTTAALQECATKAGVPELDRLVAVLSFSSETTDLGRLVSAEAKACRQEAQRRLTQLLDKRAQQVWIPVTVATLVPGVIFLSIPFLQALRQFSAS